MPKTTEAQRTGLVWFRTGLRLEDNTALAAALHENEAVRCLYVLDDAYLRGQDIGAARAAFLFASLQELAEELHRLGGQLILRTSRSVPEEVVSVAQEVGAGRLYVHEDYLPYPRQRDRRTRDLARAEGVEMKFYRDTLLADPNRILQDDGAPFIVFTPFKRRWETLLQTPARYAIESHLAKFNQPRPVPSLPVPDLADYGLTLTQQIEPGGARRAQARLREFVATGLATYHQNRNFCADPNSSSRLSMHLKWGTISVRDCYRAAREVGGPGAEKWIDELAWREFFHAILVHFPHCLEGAMNPTFDDFPWSDNRDHWEAWKAGRTGIPFVDAGMRQLNATGWMHNRTRQVVASYLVKDLSLPWQWGERYFMQALTDGDWYANNGNWQYVTGTGTDPRSGTRIFNPHVQRERYDPQAEYVRQWVPEFGSSRYPPPIVPHEVGRARYLERFGKTKAGKRLLPTSAQDETHRLF